MSHNALVFGTINFEELPLHLEHRSIQSLLPSSIEEDEDDPRSLLYLFEDNDFEQAATYLAIEEARRQAQSAADALAEAEAQQRQLLQQQRARQLAVRLAQLFEDDDELIDMLGRRILAIRGYQVPDLWRPQYYHHFYHRHGPQHYHLAGTESSDPQHASTSRLAAADAPRRPRASDIHTAWDDFEHHSSLSDHARAGPFIHAAPLILQGNAPYPPRIIQRSAVEPGPARDDQYHPSPREPASENDTRIAIHPLTGVPMLLVEDDSEERRAARVSSTEDPVQSLAGFASDEEADEWAVEDESDLDWLGRELLRRQDGANVWILGTHGSALPTPQELDHSSELQEAQHTSAPLTSAATSSSSHGTAPAIASRLAKRMAAATPTLPVEIEEVDSDRELASAASALDPGRGENASVLSSPSQRVAAALARAALGNQTPSPTSKTETGSTGGRPRRQRAATVMSESEEEELETVGVPVDDEKDHGKGDDAGRPRKSVKVVDIR